jgi:hypothetical protein
LGRGRRRCGSLGRLLLLLLRHRGLRDLLLGGRNTLGGLRSLLLLLRRRRRRRRMLVLGPVRLLVLDMLRLLGVLLLGMLRLNMLLLLGMLRLNMLLLDMLLLDMLLLSVLLLSMLLDMVLRVLRGVLGCVLDDARCGMLGVDRRAGGRSLPGSRSRRYGRRDGCLLWGRRGLSLRGVGWRRVLGGVVGLRVLAVLLMLLLMLLLLRLLLLERLLRRALLGGIAKVGLLIAARHVGLWRGREMSRTRIPEGMVSSCILGWLLVHRRLRRLLLLQRRHRRRRLSPPLHVAWHAALRHHHSVAQRLLSGWAWAQGARVCRDSSATTEWEAAGDGRRRRGASQGPARGRVTSGQGARAERDGISIWNVYMMSVCRMTMYR